MGRDTVEFARVRTGVGRFLPSVVSRAFFSKVFVMTCVSTVETVGLTLARPTPLPSIEGGGHTTGMGGVGTDMLVGQLFVEAPNTGPARAGGVASSGPPRVVDQLPQLSDPFAIAVLSMFRVALSSVLTTGELGDVDLQAALCRRGQQLMAAALDEIRRPARRTVPGEQPPSVLSTAHEALVLTLLMECAALTVLEDRRFPTLAARPADVVRALGRSARSTMPEAAGVRGY